MKQKNNQMSAWIIVILSIFSTCIIAADISSPAAKKLISDVIKQGKVRVIVNLTSPTLPASVKSLDGKVYDIILSTSISRIQDAVLDRLSALGEQAYGITRFHYTAQMALTVTKTGLTALMSDPDVVQIHEDRLNKGNLGQSVPLVFPSHQASPYSGEGWTVAVLDTGIDKSHPTFGNRIVSEACFSNNTNGGLFTNYYSLCPNSQREQQGEGSGINCHTRMNQLKTELIREEEGTDCGHGTAVAGVAAGDFGDIQGVARDANLIAIQIFTAVTGTNEEGNNIIGASAFSSDIMKGLERVYELRHSHQIASANLSISGGGNVATENQCNNATDGNGLNYTNVLRPSIELLKQANIATVIASGNDGHTSGVGSIACIKPAITVGATDDNDNLYFFSNSGNLLDLWAPGVEIITAKAGGGLTEPIYGTSFAAPHVAGAWAVMKQHKSDATVDQIEMAFKTTGRAITANGITRQRINIDEALDTLENPPTASHIIHPTDGSTLSGSIITFQWKDVGAKQYILSVGTQSGGYSNDIYYQYFPGTTTSATVNNIPTNGNTIYVRLWTQQPSEQWYTSDTSYLTGTIGSDADGDGIADANDNCTLLANINQHDSDNDGFGNRCDADLDNNGSVSFADLNLFRARFGTADPDADLDGNGSVSFADLNIFRSLFGSLPGPSGLAQ